MPDQPRRPHNHEINICQLDTDDYKVEVFVGFKYNKENDSLSNLRVRFQYVGALGNVEVDDSFEITYFETDGNNNNLFYETIDNTLRASILAQLVFEAIPKVNSTEKLEGIVKKSVPLHFQSEIWNYVDTDTAVKHHHRVAHIDGVSPHTLSSLIRELNGDYGLHFVF